MLGAEVIVESMLAHEIERVYVFPGGTIAPILDCAKHKGLNIFCARHEQGAGYAALAAARLSGKCQVAMVTSGPGVTNIITSVADAYYDSTPLVLLTGQVGTSDLCHELPIRQRGFQEVDTLALLTPVTKAQFLVERCDDLPQIMAQAFFQATNGRSGPVVVDLPMDVQRNELHETSEIQVISKSARSEPDDAKLDQIIQWLSEAKSPLIIAGQGVLQSGGQTELRKLVDLVGIPVSHSLLGLGAIPSDSPMALGFHGHTGNQYAGKAIHNADFVLVLGSRLDVRQTGNRYEDFVPNGRVVRIDFDAAELEHCRVHTEVVFQNDVRDVLEGINARLLDKPLPDFNDWHAQINQWRQEYPLIYASDDKHGPLKPQHIIEAVNRLSKNLSKSRRVTCISGVGSHQHWVARHFEFDFPQRRWLTSGGHGAMGYDLPTAVGAQLHDPDALVLCIVGDGSLQINIQELAAVAENRLPVKIIVLDNHRLGIVSQFQQFNWQDDPTTGNKWNPDFAAIATAYGIPSFLIKTANEVEPILSLALKEPGAALVHCLVDENEDIVPMLLAGQTLDRMWPYDGH